MRAAGGLIACVPRAYVWHRGRASFGSAAHFRAELVANLRLVLARWPGYLDDTGAFARDNPLRALHEQLWDRLLGAERPQRAHVLHVLPRWELDGPLRARMLALIAASAASAVHTLVVPVPDGPGGHWIDAIDHESSGGWRVCGVLSFERGFGRFLAASPATLVHVHGEGGHARAAIDAARAQRRPAIATVEAPEDAARCERTYARYTRNPARDGGEGALPAILPGSVGA